jgi:hypothetical protein
VVGGGLFSDLGPAKELAVVIAAVEEVLVGLDQDRDPGT